MDKNIHIMTHPLIQHKVSILRDKNTTVKQFRELVNEIAMLMCFDATRDLEMKDVDIETPVATAHTKMLAGPDPAIVPILRAGMGMLDGILNLMPYAKVGHVGLYRDPETLNPVEYYCKMPGDLEERTIILLDPMLATGGSAAAAIDFVKQRGGKNIKMMNLVAAPEGIEVVRKAHPDIPIIMVTRPVYLEKQTADQLERRTIIKNSYNQAVKNGDENVYFIDGNDFFPKEMPDLYTIDMTHPNDLGMYYMAKTIFATLKPALEKSYPDAK